MKNSAQRFPRYWHYYFLALFICWGTYAAIILASAVLYPSTVDWGGVGLGAFALWPLWGYIKQRRCPPRWLAFIFFAISLFLLVTAVLSALYATIKMHDPDKLALLILTALIAPYTFAMREYFFNSQHIWHVEHLTPSARFFEIFTFGASRYWAKPTTAADTKDEPQPPATKQLVDHLRSLGQALRK